MKKALYFLLVALVPEIGFCSNTLNSNSFKIESKIPSIFRSSSQIESLEWGCPVADVIKASNSADAMAKIGQACMDDVRKAAVEKPGVFDVIRVSVVWPDVHISSTQQGYKMEGTIFLETLVMKGQETLK